MPEIQKTVLEELLIDEDTGRAAEVRTVDNDLLPGIEGVQSVFQALKMDRTGNAFRAKQPFIQTIDQLEVSATIQLLL